MHNIFILLLSVKIYEFIIDEEADTIIKQFKYIKLKGIWYLVVCYTDCCKIFSEDGQTLFFHFKLNIPSNKKKLVSEYTNYFTGICLVDFKKNQYIAVGTSFGEIYFFDNVKEKIFNSFLGTSLKLSIPFVEIANMASDNTLIISDIEGNLLILLINEIKNLVLQKEIDTKSQKTPITNLCLIDNKFKGIFANNLIIIGDYLGMIKIYETTGYNLLMEISAHARLITCLDLKENPFEIISGSEDGYLNFWKIEFDENNDFLMKGTLKVSFRIADQMIMGIKSLGTAGTAISIYDSFDISIINYEK